MLRALKVFAAIAVLAIASSGAVAQQTRKAKLGFISWWAPQQSIHLEWLREGLRELGYAEGRNIEIEGHFTAGNRERTRELARAFVAKGVDILVVSTTPAIHIAKEATQTIPIVMAPVADAIATGLVKSLARPGGNLTGLTMFGPDLAAKRLELLKEIRPQTRIVAFLGSSTDANTQTFVRGTQQAADRYGLKLLVRLVEGPGAIDGQTFAAMKREGVEAVVVQPIFMGSQDGIVSAATKAGLPVISDYPTFAEAGAVLTLGTNDKAQMKRAAYFVDRILKGDKPADLPIEQPTTFIMAVNVRAAKALGWTIPESFLIRADRVIE
jgi:putative ABC transport system substrate-binding protein